MNDVYLGKYTELVKNIVCSYRKNDRTAIIAYIEEFKDEITKKAKKQVIDKPLLDFLIDLESLMSPHKLDTYQNRHMIELFLRIKKFRQNKEKN